MTVNWELFEQVPMNPKGGRLLARIEPALGEAFRLGFDRRPGWYEAIMCASADVRVAHTLGWYARSLDEGDLVALSGQAEAQADQGGDDGDASAANLRRQLARLVLAKARYEMHPVVGMVLKSGACEPGADETPLPDQLLQQAMRCGLTVERGRIGFSEAQGSSALICIDRWLMNCGGAIRLQVRVLRRQATNRDWAHCSSLGFSDPLSVLEAGQLISRWAEMAKVARILDEPGQHASERVAERG